jgi:elongation factor G
MQWSGAFLFGFLRLHGQVVGDLCSRRGRILGMDSEGQFQIVRADVPAMKLYRYASVLRALTGARRSQRAIQSLRRTAARDRERVRAQQLDELG